jgi:hypothetical protein
MNQNNILNIIFKNGGDDDHPSSGGATSVGK